MPRSLINTGLSIVAAMTLASCGEKQSRSDPEGHRAYSNETPQHPAYERTVKQGGADRMSK
jgi:hypothetical protein